MWKATTVDRWISGRGSDLASAHDPVVSIIEQVRSGGDSALKELTERFDGQRLDDVRVSDAMIDEAYEEADDRIIEAIIEADARIARFHLIQRPRDLWFETVEPGVTLGVRSVPLERIGAYIPGGRASYPSTALMCTVPARVAGVGSICCCSPPPISPLTLVALDVAGVDEIYQVGGAQAIAAMALGTESVRPVQKIVGPGNIFVTKAKMILRDQVEIDFPAGPSEIAILADETGVPEFIAADILAQAEHDPRAACILITTSPTLAEETATIIGRNSQSSERSGIIRQSLENAGYILIDTIGDGIDAVNRIAPEHLSLMVKDPLLVLNRIRSSGSIFIGPYSAVAFGDYSSGTNHVLPTAGYARVASGLDVMHFIKRVQIQMIDRDGAEALADLTETLATAEGLEAHATSSRIRRHPGNRDTIRG